MPEISSTIIIREYIIFLNFRHDYLSLKYEIKKVYNFPDSNACNHILIFQTKSIYQNYYKTSLEGHTLKPDHRGFQQ